MRILIDECVPRKFKLDLSVGGHECLTVPEAGFAGRKNGELLELAEHSFEVFLTLDKGVRYQQNMTGRKIAILVVRAKSNRLADVRPHAEKCLLALQNIRPGQIVELGMTEGNQE
jgi:predicted nuclease of predicted toxin-antitoxin system